MSEPGTLPSRFTPKTARRFAEARGRLAKTDRLGAIKASARLRAFHQAVTARTGSAKAVIIAVARKLPTILNAMQRDKTNFAVAMFSKAYGWPGQARP